MYSAKGWRNAVLTAWECGRRHHVSMTLCICVAGPGVEPEVFVGRTEGRVVPARGPASFGWDPIFEPEGSQETYAQLDKAVKNTISHRRARCSVPMSASWNFTGAASGSQQCAYPHIHGYAALQVSGARQVERLPAVITWACALAALAVLLFRVS